MTTFQHFSNLPLELRERIWQYAFLEPRIIHIQLDGYRKQPAPGDRPGPPLKQAWYWTWENRDKILTRKHPHGRDYPWTRREQTLRITSKESKECVERFAWSKMRQLPEDTPLEPEHEHWLNIRRYSPWSILHMPRPKIVEDEEFEARRLADFTAYVDFESDIFYLYAAPSDATYGDLYNNRGWGISTEFPKFMLLLRHVAINLRQADLVVAAELYRREKNVNEDMEPNGIHVHSLFHGLLNNDNATQLCPHLETLTVFLNEAHKREFAKGGHFVQSDTIGHDAGRLVHLSFDELGHRYGDSHRAEQTLAVAARVKAVMPHAQLAVLDGSTRLDTQNRHNGWWLWFFREVVSPDGHVKLLGCRTARERDDRDPGRLVLDAESARQVRRFWASRQAGDPPIRPEDYARFNIRCAPLEPKIPYPYAGR